MYTSYSLTTTKLNRYSNGLSERIIGKAIKLYEIPREQLVILTKFYFGFDDAQVFFPKVEKKLVYIT